MKKLKLLLLSCLVSSLAISCCNAKVDDYGSKWTELYQKTGGDTASYTRIGIGMGQDLYIVHKTNRTGEGILKNLGIAELYLSTLDNDGMEYIGTIHTYGEDNYTTIKLGNKLGTNLHP